MSSTIEQHESASSLSAERSSLLDRRRAGRLQAAAEIARDATARRGLAELLQTAATLIHDRLDFYHVALYLLDEAREYAVLQAIASPAAEALLKQGHRLKVGGQSMIGFVAETGLPRLSEDVEQDPFFLRNPLLAETRAEVTLPLKVMGRVIGVLDVQSRVENDFDYDDVHTLQIVADQMAISLENARLFESDQRQLKELTILNAVATACAQIDSEDLLLERITNILGSALYTHNFGILLLDARHNFIMKHPSYRTRIHEATECYPSDAGIAGKVLRERKPICLADVSQDPDYLNVDPETRSELCVPILAGDQAIGVINAENGELNAFTEADERLLVTIAGTLASALQRIRLHALESRRQAVLEALRQAAVQFNSTLELNPLLKVILTHTLQLCPATNAHIFLYDGARLTFGAALFREQGFVDQPLAEPRPHGLTYSVARSGQMIVVEDMSTHPLFADWPQQGSIVGIPLRLGEQVLGVINVACAEPGCLNEDEVNSLQLLADQAAMAVANARLYEESLTRARALAQAYAQQQEFDRMKAHFIQNVSNELRTPVSVILGYSNLLEDGDLGELTTDQQDAVSVIARRARLITKLLDNLTTILETESGEMRWEKVDLVELLEELLSEMRRDFIQANLKLSTHLEIGLPRIQGVRQHLRRAFENLLHNALKFTPDYGSVQVELRQQGREVIFSVRDSGIGISPEEQERIFERFYQAETAPVRRLGGVGLGLALVKQVAEAHRGSVGVESEPGQGSRFWMRLPIE